MIWIHQHNETTEGHEQKGVAGDGGRGGVPVVAEGWLQEVLLFIFHQLEMVSV